MRDPRAASIFATLIAVTHHLNGLDFVAVDFETANTTRASLCSVGAVRVRNGIIVESFSTLVKPAHEHNFSPSNVRVHGITADHVETACPWLEVLSGFTAFRPAVHDPRPRWHPPRRLDIRRADSRAYSYADSCWGQMRQWRPWSATGEAPSGAVHLIMERA